ncbi:MAG: hypothetical protein NXI16_05140 [Alphaproteobacteria bacterium]|nr:hypothetical protein [Alphaproteobacteria bacterium]
MTVTKVALIILVAALFAAPAAVRAQVDDRSNSRILQRTTAPYWDVGERSKVLSNLCSNGEFNQARRNRLVIEFVGDRGRGRLGIAQGKWNLRDPNRVSDPDTSYYFLKDGTTKCEVFYFGKAPEGEGEDQSAPVGPDDEEGDDGEDS